MASGLVSNWKIGSQEHAFFELVSDMTIQKLLYNSGMNNLQTIREFFQLGTTEVSTALQLSPDELRAYESGEKQPEILMWQRFLNITRINSTYQPYLTWLSQSTSVLVWTT